MALVGTLECNRLTDRGFQQLQRAGIGIFEKQDAATKIGFIRCADQGRHETQVATDKMPGRCTATDACNPVASFDETFA